MELSEIDLLNPHRFEASVPHEWFTYLRHNAPFYRHPEPDGRPGFWVVTRYDDVVAINRDGDSLLLGAGARRRGRAGGPRPARNWRRGPHDAHHGSA